MQPDQWETVKALFHTALDQPPAERAAYVARETANNLEVRESVLSLLDAHDESGDFMETPAAVLHAEDLREPLPTDGRVGPYRLLREIGRGGMGTVYLAARVDGEFEHQVAVKLVKRGMDTDLILNRFRHERQILASLDHPNIARLLDGGTTPDGRPYFVLEYVDGNTIRDFCDTAALSIRERLTLFRTICAAVQYAHQNLVVHRDIKANNILVTRDGVPKLLDFGIAKLLDPNRAEGQTVLTDTVRALTPEYASPEQIRGEPVTTTTDVYSLGVLLYELLCGSRPFGARGARPEDVARAVCDTEPPFPSNAIDSPQANRVRRDLRGDLDTIVLMAMRKDPRRRYTSVEQFSEDIRRHLEGLPVQAQRDTLAYRVTKFARRNRPAIAASVLILSSLVGGLATTIWQARVARAERARAERRFGEVRSLATTFLFELHDAIASLPGSTPARALLVQRALTALDGLANDAQGDPVLQRELAVAYQKVGDVQGNSYNSNLGNTAGALQSYQKSVRLLEPVAKSDSANANVMHALARSYQGTGDLLASTGDLKGALHQFELALTVRRQLVQTHPKDAVLRAALAEVYNETGDTKGGEGLANLGDSQGAMESYRASVALRETNLAASPGDVDARVGLASSLMNVGYLGSSLGDSSAAQLIVRSVALMEGVVAERPNDVPRRAELLSAYVRLRQPLADAARFSEALAVDRKTLAMLDGMIAADSTNTFFQRNRGAVLNYVGRDLRESAQAPLAVAMHRKALAVATLLASRDTNSIEHTHDIAMSRYWLAEALAAAHDYAPALEQYHLAVASKVQLRVREPSNLRHGDDLALMYGGLGNALAATHDLLHADSALALAVPLAQAAALRNTANRKAQIVLALTFGYRGQLAVMRRATAVSDEARREQCGSVVEWYEKSAAIWGAMSAAGRMPRLHAARPIEADEAIRACRPR